MNDDFVDLAKFDGKMFDDFSKTKLADLRSVSKIPVAILTGFLGSGKTTLLNNILRDSGLKIGVIINDFGSINIDAKLLSTAPSEQTIELTNGCVCCILGDNGLREPLQQLANADSDLDAIIIEASGAADPIDLIKTIRFSGNDFTYFGGNILLVDAINFSDTARDFPSHFKKSIRTADIILTTKTSDLDSGEIATLHADLRQGNPHAPILDAPDSTIDPRILFSKRLQENPDQLEIETNHHHCDENCHHSHIHHHFSSLTFESDAPLSPRAFIDFLDNLPQNLFRAKGILYFGMKGYEQKYRFQLVGKSVEISAEEWNAGEKQKSQLVLIGANIDTDKIQSQLETTIDHTPDSTAPEEMVNFERFFQR